jgi:hypothetical protein
MTDEAVRKRHIRCLMRMKKRFRVKSQQELENLGEVSRIVRRRGIKRAKRVSDIVPEAEAEVEDRTTTPSLDIAPSAPTPELNAFIEPPTKKRKHILSSHLFEKCRIVIWRNAEGLGWKDIRDKLEMEYEWSLGTGTIEKYYYLTLERVYGSGRKEEVKKKERGWDDLGEERVVERRMSF